MMARCMRRNVRDACDQRTSLIVTKTDGNGDDFEDRCEFGRGFREVMRGRRD